MRFWWCLDKGCLEGKNYVTGAFVCAPDRDAAIQRCVEKGIFPIDANIGVIETDSAVPTEFQDRFLSAADWDLLRLKSAN